MAGARPFIDRSRRHIFLPLCAAAVISAIAAAYAVLGTGAPASRSDDRAVTSRPPGAFTLPGPWAPLPTGAELSYAPPSWGYRNVLSPIDRMK